MKSIKLTDNLSAEMNEKYISYHKNRNKLIVRIKGKHYGYFCTIEGAREKKAEILRRNEIVDTEKNLRELNREIWELEKQLSHLIGDTGK